MQHATLFDNFIRHVSCAGWTNYGFITQRLLYITAITIMDHRLQAKRVLGGKKGLGLSYFEY